MKVLCLAATALILAAFTILPTTVSADELTCKSTGDFKRCSLPNANRLHVSLSEDLTRHKRCEKGYNWGADSDGIWVDSKCKAVFHYSGEGGRHADYSESYTRHNRRAGSCPTDLGGNECEYYMDGYKAGKGDADMSMSRLYERHGDDYDSRFEAYFSRGYQSGWNDNR